MIRTNVHKKVKVTKKIICLNDNKEFKTASEAARSYGLALPHLIKVAKGESVYEGKIHENGEAFRFAYLDEEGNPVLKEERIKNQIIYRYKVTNTKTSEVWYCKVQAEIKGITKFSCPKIARYFLGVKNEYHFKEDISPYVIEKLK
jgi:hypothetical protein